MNEKKDIYPEASSVHSQGSSTDYIVCCSGFTNDVAHDFISKTFSQYGTIVAIRIFNEHGSAFIKFTTEEAATRAVQATNNTEINGSIIKSFLEKINSDPNSDGLTANQQIEPIDGGQSSAAGGSQAKNPKDIPSKKLLTKGRIITIASGGIGAVGAVLLAPVAITALGFTAGGIAAGSVAASMMSVLGGGATAAGGIVATCQTIGATGTILGSSTMVSAVSTIGGGIGCATAKLFRSIKKKK